MIKNFNKIGKPILISGIQPTGKLHLGNYLGALKSFVKLQNSGKYNCYFFIADFHALTENPKAKDLSVNIRNLAADFLAAGLDPKKSTIFVQSQISAHSELAWILNTITPMGELRRMTQFKEKTSEAFVKQRKLTGEGEILNVGLFSYPVLMTADILLYDAQFVPVGADQLQHLELARTIARKFNAKFGKTFIEPKAILTEASRIMSLDDPAQKMSKSRPAGCVFLDDSPKIIREKLARAVTDSGHEIKYDLVNKPAISNLLTIYSSLTNKPIKILEKKYIGQGYADFKKDLAETIIASLKLFQKKKSQLKPQTSNLKTILKAGARKAQKRAQSKLREIKKKAGLFF